MNRTTKSNPDRSDRTLATDYSEWSSEEFIARLEILQRRIDELELELTSPDKDDELFAGHEIRFRTLFKNSPLPIFVWRREGDDFVRIDHNDAGRDLVHGTADSATGMKVSEYLADWPDLIRCIHQCFEQRKTVTHFRKRSLPPEAPPRWVESTFVFVPPDLVMAHIHDLTNRVEAEIALRESEEQLRAITDNNPSMIYLRDKDAKFLKINKTYENFYGVTQQEVVGRHGDEWLGKEIAQRIAREDREILSTGRPMETEFKTIDSVGKPRYTRSVKFPVVNEEGSVVAVGGTTTDITERMLAQIELERQKSFFESLVENIPVTVSMRDKDGIYLFVNKKFCELFNTTPDEMIGKSATDAFGVDPDSQYVEFVRMAIEKGEPIIDVDRKSEFADNRLVSLNFVPIKGPEGKVDRLITIAFDITERELARTEIEQQKLFFESLVENIPANVTMRDSDGKFVFVNKMICDISNKTPDEFIGKSTTEAFGVDPDSPVSEIPTRVIETGEPLIGIERTSEFANERLYSLNYVPIKGPDGKVDHLLTIAFEITEQRRREEQLRQSQKMEAVGQLTGGVAHDFNNLLTVVMGNLELLSDLVSDNETALSYADRAISGAQRGADLTHRLLAFSRKQALNPVIIDPRRLVDDLLDLMRRTLGETIEIVDLQDDNVGHCEVDPAQLESAILNLAINARDAMQNGGKLTIMTENVLLDDTVAAQAEVTPGQYVMIAVSDTGTGIPAEAIDHVFEPFFTTKDTGKGSGLGLSMVYGFVKQSGGHVRIHSKDGAGTTVRMYLPKSVAEADDALQEDLETGPRARGETILLVEDDPDVRTLAVALLSDLGYRVLEARDGHSALAILDRTASVDMLLTDVVLPDGMSGLTLAEEVEHRCPGLSVLFMSGYAEDATIRLGQPDLGVELLNKPFRKIDLARKVRSVLDKASS